MVVVAGRCEVITLIEAMHVASVLCRLFGCS